ncbi:helix-hairpin-helix domain-containing protein [Candidatus Woesearchaeota archaeon]|jgi:hypothetical protein|nr:helix-hairpin-helix domain-containing protein [Candidatus Woesearchaeota archaeon]
MIKIKNFLIILFIFFTFLNFSSRIICLCNSSQIDINSANLSELDKIITIGEVLAQRIIESRPFSSLDDLIKVKGIGNITLSKIKSQGLACVNESFNNQLINTSENNTNETFSSISQNSQNNKENNPSINSTNSIINNKTLNLSNSINKTNQTFVLEKIILNSKDIKTEKTKTVLEKISIYVIIFLGFILILLILNRRKKLKNELQ